ncbi:MAG: hypothetical protein GWN58_21150 [Anaerolineae bacterium]|nr:hypothetical protein [Anaerolineae bacterium]
MSDLKRELIGSVQLGKTKSGKVKADLYSTNKRLEYPALTLFDLSLLETVGIDPNKLGLEPVHKRFWAFYTENQEKLTSRGNPYRDVSYFELIDNGNTSPDTGAIMAELRELRVLLELIAVRLGADLPQVTLGDSDELADWLGDEETRSEEQAIHDELEAMNQARQNGKTQVGIPMDSEELVAWLNARNDNPKACDGVGHLTYVMKKQFGDDWGWPNGTDGAGWNNVVKAWYEYWKALT